jgi:hypothetical protein
MATECSRTETKIGLAGELVVVTVRREKALGDYRYCACSRLYSHYTG